MTTITKKYGENVTFTATPNNGYTFSTWSGDISGGTSPQTVTVTGNMSVTANFSQAGPSISTPVATDIGTNTVRLTANFNSAGETETRYGFVCSSNQGTISNLNDGTYGGAIIGSGIDYQVGSNEVLNGSKSRTVSSLNSGITYYAKAYMLQIVPTRAPETDDYIYKFSSIMQFTTNAPTPSYGGEITFMDFGASAITDCFDSNWIDNYTVTSLNTMTGARGIIFLNSNVNDFSSTFTYNEYLGSILDFKSSNIVSIGGYGSTEINVETLVLPDTLEDVGVDVLGADICYCLATNPPSLTGTQIQIGVLYVPAGCASDYEDSDWGAVAGEIQEMDE